VLWGETDYASKYRIEAISEGSPGVEHGVCTVDLSEEGDIPDDQWVVLSNEINQGRVGNIVTKGRVGRLSGCQRVHW
jgi:hypothetical protein